MLVFNNFHPRKELSMPACATQETIPETAPISNLFLPVLDNLNVISHRTRELIFDRQIARILGEGLDDFKTLTIDSTSVKANSSWPNDAKILTGLLMRVDRLGQKLDVFGLENFRQGWVPRWLEEMDKLEFQICLVAGKANSKGKLKKRYRRLLRLGRKAADALQAEFDRFEQIVSIDALAPSRRVLLQRVVDQIRTDLCDAGREIISISGAKGKKLTTVEDWESETYRDARRYRSAVESLMFTIKDGFAFGELGRRGIEAVRDELLEKVLAYNCCRSILLRQRQREELEPAA